MLSDSGIKMPQAAHATIRSAVPKCFACFPDVAVLNVLALSAWSPEIVGGLTRFLNSAQTITAINKMNMILPINRFPAKKVMA